jgi:hypothetical protein
VDLKMGEAWETEGLSVLSHSLTQTHTHCPPPGFPSGKELIRHSIWDTRDVLRT